MAPPARIGTSSTIRMTAKSWKMSVARLRLPAGVSVSPRSDSSESTMAVDERPTRKPVKIAAFHDTPSAIKMPVVTATVPIV